MSNTRIGFVGLGKMGAPIVRRLLAAGFTVHGANRSSAIVAELAAEGMHPEDSAGAVTAAVDVVLTALPNEESVRAVADEVLAASRQGQILIEHSTISPGLAKRIAAEAGAIGVGYLDGPVSGGPAGAESGRLTVMAGGDAALLERCRPILAAFGDPIRHCGDIGAGQAVKLVNQLLVAIHTSAAAEAAAFGVKIGASLESIVEVIGTSFGASAMLNRNVPRFAAGDYSPATPVSLILKDLGLIQHQAEELHVPLRLGVVAETLFAEAGQIGLGDRDMAALFQLWARQG